MYGDLREDLRTASCASAEILPNSRSSERRSFGSLRVEIFGHDLGLFAPPLIVVFAIKTISSLGVEFAIRSSGDS